MDDAFARLENIEKSFSTVAVLKKVTIGIGRGEIIGLIGENGAGKSTLMKILSGIHEPNSGRILIEGRERRFRRPADAKAAGIAIVPQEFNLCPQLSVAENVFLGAEPLTRAGFLDGAAMRARASELLAELGVRIDPDERISRLSAAQKQIVEICKALAFDARLLILDEPTTVLTPVEIASLFALMRAVKAKGMSMVYISHKLGEVMEICDRVAILRDGELVHEAPTSALSPAGMASRMVGRELSEIYPEPAPARDEVLLKIEGLSSPGAFSGVGLELRAGEVLGLAGLVGAGRTEVAEAVMGLRPATGRVVVGGAELRLGRPREAIAAGVGYLSEDRQGSGVLVAFSVAENETLASLPAYARGLFGPIDRRREREAAEKWARLFSIKAASSEQRLEHLSGGNQQKVSLAKSLDPAPRVLIVDEPTRGVDVGAKREIYRLLRDLAAEGIAILLISSELEEVLGMCGRVVVMREGRSVGELAGAELTEEGIMFLATGIKEGESA
ncbi:MAG: sugar ABC transporter ATP-binding protein [Spirochaetaceae bacterium]|nr:sugar ABC transporter ATP-binding protein [Spirochaetaceae bacterium]